MKKISTLVFLISSAFLYGCDGTIPYTHEIERREENKLTPQQVGVVQGAVRYNLVEPGSADFRNLRASNVYLKSGRTLRYVCGEVNSRNRMGGFAGFSTFYGFLSDDGRSFELVEVDDVSGVTAGYVCSTIAGI